MQEPDSMNMYVCAYKYALRTTKLMFDLVFGQEPQTYSKDTLRRFDETKDWTYMYKKHLKVFTVDALC